jgi:hypothetical protein
LNLLKAFLPKKRLTELNAYFGPFCTQSIALSSIYLHGFRHFINRHALQIFQGNMQLIFDRQCGRFASFPVQNTVFSLDDREHFFKNSGFHPVQPFKNNRFGILCLFPFSMPSSKHF